MKCNIDRKGRTARIIFGAICDGIGSLLIVLAVVGSGPFWILLIAGIMLMAAGLFSIVEGMIGWCATRAMGFKTPM